MNFQIATGEDSDSIFENGAALGQKYPDHISDSSSDQYGEEGDHDADENDYEGDEAEAVPQIDHTLQP